MNATILCRLLKHLLGILYIPSDIQVAPEELEYQVKVVPFWKFNKKGKTKSFY